MDLKVEMTVRMTDEDIDDIMVGALEGGICYWCDRVEVNGDYLGECASEQISRGGQLKVYPEEPYNDTEMFVLDKERFTAGVKKYIAMGHADCLEIERMKNGLPTGRILIDPCNVDAEAADCIVQLALFDEIVYG